MLGIAPIVYPSIRCGGPGGADLMVIDQSRAMSATLPSKRTGDAFEPEVMRTDCLIRSLSAERSGARTPDRVVQREAPATRGERYIRTQRLHRCLDELTRPANLPLKVSEIGTRWGFENPSHFNRLCKAEFGVPPSVVRSRRRVQTLGSSPLAPLRPRLGHAGERMWRVSVGVMRAAPPSQIDDAPEPAISVLVG
jgi:AraC-like DNA-binding protein